MPDQIPADEVRKIVNNMHRHAEHDTVRGTEEEYTRHFAALLEALLPSPPPPTLADMTPEERAACQWMQADVENRSVRCVIATPYDEGSDTALVSADGEIGWMSPERVTPRPDLPRMEWPGNQEADPAPAPALPDGWRLADHPEYGRVVVTRATPGYEGDAHFVYPADARSLGYTWHCCDPDELTYLDQEADQ